MKNIGQFEKGHIPWNKNKKCPQLSKALRGRKISQKQRDAISKANTGENNYLWQQHPTYTAIHCWLKYHFGKANNCENRIKQFLGFKCSGKCEYYEWANMNNHIYRRRREDFKMLCNSCHQKYDAIKN